MQKTTAITKGVLVSVEVIYQPEHSNPRISRFVFSYNVVIENLSKVPVQLLRRHWIIFESNGTKREVEGAGVIGEQPIIQPNERFQYTSWCPIQNKIGYMEGSYLMKNEETEEVFEAEIPRFHLIPPNQLN